MSNGSIWSLLRIDRDSRYLPVRFIEDHLSRLSLQEAVEEYGDIGILPAHRTNKRWTKKNRRPYTKDHVDIANIHGMIMVIRL